MHSRAREAVIFYWLTRCCSRHE